MRSVSRDFVALLAVVGLGVLLSGCGSDDCSNTGSCGSYTGGAGGNGGDSGSGATGGGGTGNTSGTSGTGGTAGDSGTCDTSKSPGDESCLIDEQYGVFVDAGSTAGSPDGTRTAPYKTIADALTNAGGKKIYVCNTDGDYAEDVALTASLDGTTLHGGFNCADWTYDTATKAVVKGSATPWIIDNLAVGTTIEDFDIQAANATGDGASSIAVAVTSSANVVLRRLKITAGNGAKGKDGTDGAKGTDGADPGTSQDGKPACTGSGGQLAGGEWSAPSGCGSNGGLGGLAKKDALADGGSGDDGTPKTSVTPPNFSNGGAGATLAGASGSAGQSGANGDAGNLGQAASAIGMFAVGSYSTADGDHGLDGHTGQGGGGGGASKGTGTCNGASGAAGGMGGCGGKPGTGGQGGGASVALLSWQSSITLDSCDLNAATGGVGGKGGKGGDGGAGKSGGTGGPGTGGIGGGGDGGKGGTGGPGGSGSGGSGGPSYALVWNGTAPLQNGAVNLNKGAGGAKGVGGQVVGLPKAPDGSDGDSAESYEQK